jgi:hypothetical protein
MVNYIGLMADIEATILTMASGEGHLDETSRASSALALDSFDTAKCSGNHGYSPVGGRAGVVADLDIEQSVLRSKPDNFAAENLLQAQTPAHSISHRAAH